MNIAGFIWFMSIVGYSLLVADQFQYIRYMAKDKNKSVLDILFRLVAVLVFLIVLNLLAIWRS